MKIKSRYLATPLVILLLAVSMVSIVFAVPAQSNGDGKVRVIAHTDNEVLDAVAKGCKVVREARTLKALICTADVASLLGLDEDIKVFATDTTANTQIGAYLVQTSGN